MNKIDKLYKDAEKVAADLSGNGQFFVLITKQGEEDQSKTLFAGDGLDILYALAGVLLRMSDVLGVPYVKARQVFNAILSDAMENDEFTIVEDLDE